MSNHLAALWCQLVACIVLMLAPSGVFSSYCQSKGPVSVMFTVANKVHFGQPGHLYSFDLASKKHGSSKLKNVTIGVHFDTYAPCENALSNYDFCDHSKVFADMALFVNAGKMSVHSVMPKSKVVSYSHAAEFNKEGAILPSLNSRLFSAIYMLFGQVAVSKNPKFTGGTFDQFTDSLFLAATVDDSVANLNEWGVGKHVLFRANFRPNGLLRDSFVVAKFDNEVVGLMDYNGDLFALTGDNTILQLSGDSFKVVKTYKPDVFFGCGKNDTPLMDPIGTPNCSDRVQPDIDIPSLGQLFFPRQPDQLKYIDSSLLTGGKFISIVVVLSVLLVIIVGIDVFIVYTMNQDMSKDYESYDSSPVKSRKSSPSSNRSSNRSKSKNKSRK